MTRTKGAKGDPAKNPPPDDAGGPPGEPTEYLTQDQARAYIRSKGIPVAINFFRDRRSKGTSPPTYYFGARALFRRDELDLWIPTLFTKRTWDRRSMTEAAVKTRARTMKVKAKAAEAMGTGEMRTE